jgi:hypothetical protein
VKKPWKLYRTRQTQVTRALKAMNSGDNRIDLPYWDHSRDGGEKQVPFLEDARRGTACY